MLSDQRWHPQSGIRANARAGRPSFREFESRPPPPPSVNWPMLQVELAVAELSITLRVFGIIGWKYHCHAVVDRPFLNIIDKGVQLVVIILEDGGVIIAMPFQRFSNPSCPGSALARTASNMPMRRRMPMVSPSMSTGVPPLRNPLASSTIVTA
jgi:hypothetical protein